MLKVCHLTSVHPRNDVRVFHKECKSLAAAGYETTLIVADGIGDQLLNGVSIKDVGKPSTRISRIFSSTLKVLKAGRKTKADIYHFHDPELIFVSLFLSFKGEKVVFDVHENIVEQIKDKAWLSKPLRCLAAFLFQLLNRLAVSFFAIIIAEHSYSKIYSGWKTKYPLTVVLNYPKLDSLKKFRSFNRNGNEFFYIGGVTNQRGLDIILEACSILKKQEIDFKVHFIGEVSDDVDKERFHDLKDKVVFYGRMDLLDGYEISKQCIAGLAILKPIGNYMNSYPTKVFEYMSIGLPVITSEFELYKEVVLKNGAGVCVNPDSAIELAEIMTSFVNQEYDISNFGQQGVKSVEEKYSWQFEEKKLLNLYDKLLDDEH